MHYALRNRYPIETDRQVKTACDYFEKNLHRFAPNDRVEAACNIEKRAADLSVAIDSPWVTNYSRVFRSHEHYSPDFRRSMEMRKHACQTYDVEIEVGDKKVKGADVVEALVKSASDRSPVEILKAVEEFDKTANLVSHYDTRIPDPYMTVFGGFLNHEWDGVKLAGSKTDYDVVRASRSQEALEKVAGLMGKGFASSFAKEPLKAVNELKDIDKVALGGIL